MPSHAGSLDEGAIRAFVQEDYRRVVNGLAVMSGSRSAAEDAVQEALARAWERSGRGERIDDLAAWVTIVARNVLRSGFRRLRLERRVREAYDRPQERLEGTGMTEDHVDVMRALAGLTAIQRETTVLHYYIGLPVADVAKALGVSEGTVKSTLHRSRQILAPALGVDDPGGAADANDAVKGAKGVTRDARR